MYAEMRGVGKQKQRSNSRREVKLLIWCVRRVIPQFIAGRVLERAAANIYMII
jgi:hypothetical protein